MGQPTFADLEYASKKRKTRREIFLERMDSLVPWDRLEGRIRPFYPKAGRGRRRQLEPGSYEALEERRKTSIRAKVEHPFLYVKRHFGYAKVRYRGLAKNTQRLVLLLGLTNLMTAERLAA